MPLFFNNKEYTVTKRVTTIKDVSYVATILPNEYFIKKNSGIRNKDSLNVILKKIKAKTKGLQRKIKLIEED